MNDIGKKYFALCVLLVSSCVCTADLLDNASITVVDSQLNASSWSAGNLIDHNNSTRWLSNKQSNDINFTFSGVNNTACFDSLDLVNYGAHGRSIEKFMLLRTLNPSLQSDTGTAQWAPIVAEQNPTGLINHLSWAQGGRIVSVDSQLNATTWAANNSNDGDSISRWLSNKSNNILEYAFDTDWDGATGDAVSIREIVVSNYGADDRSIRQFQIEVTSDGNNWRKLETPGNTVGVADFNFSLLWHGAVLSDINSQLNSTTWAAENIHDGDDGSRWLSNKSNNILTFEFDVDGDGTTGAAGDTDDLFQLERIYLKNYGTDDRAIRQFQIEYKTSSNSQWSKVPVPGSTAGEVGFNYLLAFNGAQLDAINGQLNGTTWGADNIHDGDSGSRWLNNRGNNTLDFVFDVDQDGVTGAGGDSDDVFTIEQFYLKNYGADDRSVRQFQVEVRSNTNTQWQKLRVPGSSANQPGYNFVLAVHGGYIGTIDSQLNASTWAAANIHDGDAGTRWLSNKPINTLTFLFDTDLDGTTGDSINLDTIEFTNYGNDDRSVQTFEIDIQLLGGSWQPVNHPGGGTVFTANMDRNGQSWMVGPYTQVIAVRFRTLSNHGDPNYTGARELVFSGASVGPSHTFTAAMHSNGQTFSLEPADQPTGVTDVRFRTINNHGDPTYTGAREFSVLGTSITRNHTFSAAMHSNGETFDLDVADIPVNVTEVRLLTVSNHGDPTYTGAREFSLLGPSISPSHTFTLPMSTGPHTIVLDNDDSASSVVAARLITIANHGDPTYTGLRELQLRGDPAGPSYIFNAQMNNATQTFNFQPALGRVFRFHTLSNHGNGNYTGARELVLNSSNSCVYGQWHLDELLWTGAGDEVRDSSGNNLHAMAMNNATSDGVDPAISGDPGTCRYGTFDGQDDYIEMPATFPDLHNSFTITAWIYAEDLSSSARVFADDENNSAGYALSLGDGGSGRLRFLSRGVTPVVVDTQHAVINANTWHFVAAVHDSVNNTRQIFVDGVAQPLTGGGTSAIYTGSWGTDSGRASIAGETNNAGENNANFRFQGRIDEVNIYSGVLTTSEITTLQTQTHSCSGGPAFSHLQIDIGNPNASTCTAKAISVTACANPSCSSIVNNYTGTITLSTSSGHGNWTSMGAGVLSPNPDNDDNGSISYQFHSTDNGVVTVNLSNTHAETLVVAAEDSAAGASGSSAAITFADTAFVINRDPVQVAGRPQNMSAALWTNDGSNCAIASDYSGTKNLKTWITRTAADPNGTAPTIGTLSLPNSAPSTNNLTALNFINGVAGFSLNSSDVGEYSVYLRDDTLLYSDTAVEGTAAITTRPFGFYIDVVGNPNPPATDALGSVFIGAGNDFTVSATAVLWQAVDDSNGDGIPDGHLGSDPSNNADLSDNPAAVSFGSEQNNQAETIELTAIGVLPGGGVFDDSSNAGSAPLIDSFNNGMGSVATARYSEVGIIEINAGLTDNQYLNGDYVVGASGYVGRFTPDHFIVQSPIITPAAANYTYQGQRFTASFDLVAVNASGATTENYTGNFLKLSQAQLDANANYGAVDATTFMDSRTQAFSHISSDSAGVITVANVDLVINKTSIIEAPLSNVQIGLALQDTDNVALATRDLDTSGDALNDKVILSNLPGQLRYGRVFIPPVYGPDTPQFDAVSQPNAIIFMPFEVQYFNGSHFIVNTDDNSTDYAGWSWTLIDNCSDGTIGCTMLPANFTINIPSTSQTVVRGQANTAFPITITRPGIIGDIRLGLTVDAWLQFDWDNNTTEDNPEAIVTFGSYRGHDRIIYWREKYN